MDSHPIPLVGRSVERAVLDGVTAALHKGACCLEVVGEPGIGKTAMLDLLGKVATAAGATVLSGRSSELDGDLPFGLVIDALDDHLSEIDDRWSRNVDADSLRALSAIFPALGSLAGAAAGGPTSTERFRSYRAIRTLLERLAAAGPLAVILDDVHWADGSSVELVGSLVRRLPEARVLIALSHRPRQAPERLLRNLAAGARDGVLRQMALGPLSRHEAASLLAALECQGSAEALFVESGGNPFYLHQLARTVHNGARGRPIDIGVPRAVAASLVAELDAVTKRARLFARAAAVAGDPFDFDIATAIAQLDRDGGLACLDELIAVGLVARGGGGLSFVFRHPLVRRAIHESAPHGWRIAAHARAAQELARRGASPGARAHHVERSAAVGDEQALELLVEAATAAVVPAVAAHWLRAAVRICAPAAEGYLELSCRLGLTLAAAGLIEESRTTLTGALEAWPPDGDTNGRIALVAVCARVERLLGRHDKARQRLTAAVTELDDPGSFAGVVLALELASTRVFSAEFEAVRETAAEAVRCAEALGVPLLLATAQAIAAIGDFCASDTGGARTRASTATAVVAQLTDAELALRPDVLWALGWIERCLDAYHAAVAHFDRGLAIADASGHSQLYVELKVARGSALMYWGRLAEAERTFEEAVEAARLSENPQGVGYALAFRCFAHVERGALDRAISVGREGAALAVDGSLISTTSWLALGVALAESGDWAAGIELIETRGGGPGLPGMFPLLRPYFYEAMTRAEVALGHIDRAEDWAARASATTDGVSCDVPRAQADRAAAAVLLARGDADAAARTAINAAVIAERVEAGVDAGRSRLLAGRALAALGHHADAGRQLRACEASFARCGAVRLRQQSVRELRQIGLRVARSGVRGDGAALGIGALSGREREVAGLVRARHTNREIAAQLFLSEKTIESHLRSVFVKLGVSSRADVARAVEAADH